MDDVLEAPPSGRDDLQLLAACLAEAPDGVELAYRLLDRMAERHRLDGACLLLRPAGFGPQVFVRGRVPPGADALRVLLGRPAGLYGAGPGGDPGPSVGAAVAGCCELALNAQAGAPPAAGDGRHLVAGRPGIERALVRAASRSARHGWPVTALVARLVGDSAGSARWTALAGALASVARAGDEVGDAGGGRVMAVLGGARPEVVGALLERLGDALVGAGIDPAALEVATVRLPDDTVDPEEAWRLAGERLAGDGPAPPASWTGAVPSDLELALRSLPAVLSVATAPVAGGPPELVVVATDPDAGLQAAVGRRVAERFGEGAVPVAIIAAPPFRAPADLDRPPRAAEVADGPPRPSLASVSPVGPGPGNWTTSVDEPTRPPEGQFPAAPRVALLTARFDPDTGTSEVTVARGPARATGRASAGPLAGGAQATLTALGVLGIEVPFYLLSVERARSIPGEPVVAVLAARHPEVRANGSPGPGRMSDRIGVASGPEEVEAASRATLAALNRFLAGRPAAPLLP